MRNKAYDVIFYYPQHFNRSKEGTNPFFEPLISLCEEKSLHYLLLEEPDNKTRFPKNKNAIQFDIYFYVILFLRKITPLIFFKNYETREQWIGNSMKKITFNKFNSRTVFTLSNSMGGFWRGYNRKSRIIDYQHGIIDKTQPGFFNKGKVPSHISENNKEVAVWGKGFYDIFNQDKKYYKDKVHVLGYSELNEQEKGTIQCENKILFSLQFVPESGIDITQKMLVKIKQELEELNTLSQEKTPKVILRNHPRHNNVVDLTSLVNEFKFVSIMPENEVLSNQDYFLHVTFYSTTAFEMAMKKIPTYFLITETILYGNTFLQDYNYPITQNTSLKELFTLYQNDKAIRNAHVCLVKKWSNYYFQPINKNVFLKIIND
ncbi:MAG: hypothetical protein VX762_05300 [Bacteroidota bacterium]|nr:hypothetical protein [Bacteroidota bacterium]